MEITTTEQKPSKQNKQFREDKRCAVEVTLYFFFCLFSTRHHQNSAHREEKEIIKEEKVESDIESFTGLLINTTCKKGFSTTGFVANVENI